MENSTRSDATQTGDERHSITTYLSDMLALERHMATPLTRQTQFDDTAQYASAATLISKIKTTTDAHISSLEARLDALGGHPASGLKSAWSAVIGAAAATIDSARKTRVSKSLRDDYTALSLASIGYSMLHATALGLGDPQTAALASNAMDDDAALIMAISDEMPSVVLQELVAEGVTVDPSAAAQAKRDAKDSWRRASSPN